MVRLIINHRPLASALRITPESHLGAEVRDGGSLAPGDVLITTTTDASPEDCRAFSETGAIVVMLTPLCTDTERSKYAQAGITHYLEMTANVAALIDAVRAATRPVPAALLGAS